MTDWKIQNLHDGQFKGRKQFHRAVYWGIKLKRKQGIYFRIMVAAGSEEDMGF